MAKGSMVVKTSGFDLSKVRDKLGRFKTAVESAPYIEMQDACDRLNTRMQQQVPRDSGDLARGTFASVLSRSKTEHTLIASASSEHRGYDYAGIQHDTTTYNHPVGKPFFVRDPFNATVGELSDELRDRMKW